MKKSFTIALFAITLYASTAVPSHAIFCSNCKNFVQGAFDAVKETVTAYSGTITATQQTLATINDNILIPMKDAMTLVTIMQSGTNVQNLILGATGGDSLLVRNPEVYLQNKGLAVVNASLGDIAGSKGVYSNSILASVISTNKYDAASLSTKLSSITQSTIPASEQKARCTDAALSAQAVRDVSAADGTYTQAAFTARKTELSNALCGSLSDPSTVAALNAVSQNSWNRWLASTGGDNANTKAILAEQEIAKAAEAKKTAAQADLASGGGVKSKTTCTKRATTNANGVAYAPGDISAPCISETINQTANALNASFKDALSAPLKTLQAGFGKGAGSLLSTAFQTIGLIQGISGALGGATGGGGGSSGGTTNATTVTSTNAAPVQDLANNPQTKTILTQPPKQQLQYHLDSLQGSSPSAPSLSTTDQNYLGVISNYQSKLDSVNMCYTQLFADHDEARGYPNASAWPGYYTNETSKNTALTANITAEFDLIDTTVALINSTLSKIDSTQSSQEVTDAFTNYQNQVETQKLPGILAGATREGEYIQFKGDFDATVAEDGTLTNYQTACGSIRTQIEGQGFTGAGAN